VLIKMRKLPIFLIGILIIFFQIVSAINFYYFIELENDGVNLKFKGLSIEEGRLEEGGSFSGKYLLNVFSFENKELYESNFETESYTIIDNPLESEVIYHNMTDISLFVPYYPNAKEIVIYNENLEEVTRIDVSMYSKQYEKENVVNESIKKEIDKKEQVEEERIYDKKNLSENLAEYWWILLIILIVLLIVLFSSLGKK
tara:strand:+ start:935 stop:1534 length:600 start_codon:yes stop_codon:yes gene_type:complete